MSTNQPSPVTFIATHKQFKTSTKLFSTFYLLTFEANQLQKDEILKVVSLPDNCFYKVTVECVGALKIPKNDKEKRGKTPKNDK